MTNNEASTRESKKPSESPLHTESSAPNAATSSTPTAPNAAVSAQGEPEAQDTPHTRLRQRTRNWQSGRSLSMAALFILNLFVVICVTLFAVTAIGFFTVDTGLISDETWGNPIVLTVLVLLLSALIATVVLILSERILLGPLRNMIAAVEELAAGNFDVRVERSQGFSVDEVDDFIDAFNATARELKSVEVLRSDFVDDFSHEFKTPINSINGFANLLMEDDISEEERREYAGIIARESKRLATMSEDVLALRQAESLERLPECEPVDAAEQVREAVITVSEKWASKNLELDCEITEATCTGAPALLNRVWINLLDNACKFSPEGGRVTVTLRRDTAATSKAIQNTPEIHAPQTANSAAPVNNFRASAPESVKNFHANPGQSACSGMLFQVENDGPALSPEAQQRIFGRFYQDDPSHATQGCGLGLPLVKRVVDLHEGTIQVSSTPKGHTTFVVRLLR